MLFRSKVRLRPGRLMAVYVLGYSIGRFWVEGLRIDPANQGGGMRLNQWTAIVFGVGAVLDGSTGAAVPGADVGTAVVPGAVGSNTGVPALPPHAARVAMTVINNRGRPVIDVPEAVLPAPR